MLEEKEMPWFKEYRGKYTHWTKYTKPRPTGRYIKSGKRQEFWVPTKGGKTLSYKLLTEQQVQRLKLNKKPKRESDPIKKMLRNLL